MRDWNTLSSSNSPASASWVAQLLSHATLPTLPWLLKSRSEFPCGLSKFILQRQHWDQLSKRVHSPQALIGYPTDLVYTNPFLQFSTPTLYIALRWPWMDEFVIRVSHWSWQRTPKKPALWYSFPRDWNLPLCLTMFGAKKCDLVSRESISVLFSWKLLKQSQKLPQNWATHASNQ